jgi:hypothetical protein
MGRQQGKTLPPALCVLLLSACERPGETDVPQAFVLAARKGDERAVARMIAADPSLARQPWKMPTDAPVHWYDRLPIVAAAGEGRTGIVRLLLDNGAPLESRDRWGTPMESALRSGHGEVVRLLLERGASIPPRDAEGLSALDYAVMRNSALAVVLLCARGETGAAPYDYSPVLSRFAARGGSATGSRPPGRPRRRPNAGRSSCSVCASCPPTNAGP